MIIYLKETSKSALSYGSVVKGKVIAKGIRYTSVLLPNGLAIRIANNDIIKMETAS